MIKIGELSQITGISIQTIRYYESEGLITPIEVDRWTNYRYYDERSIERLSEISYLKELGFSLKEIKNLSEESIKEKISQTKNKIKKLSQNIHKLSSIVKEKGEFIMKHFVNDEQVVGKWKKIAVVKKKEDFTSNKFDDEEIFNFKELYFLPHGEEYWVFSWTKGILYLKDRQLPYEIIDNRLFVGVIDIKTNTIDNYVVYEKVDNKQYLKDEITIKDDTNIPFIKDEKVIGFWESIDFVTDVSKFDQNKKFWKEDLYLKKYTFEPDGTLLASFNQIHNVYKINWSKSVVIDKNQSTVSEYLIKSIDNINYMFIEWKSGDYTFGGNVRGYYILKKIN